MSSQPAPPPAANPASTSVCPRCGAAFRCGMVPADAACWCVELPPLAALPVRLADQAGSADQLAVSCFCPACLKSLTDSTDTSSPR